MSAFVCSVCRLVFCVKLRISCVLSFKTLKVTRPDARTNSSSNPVIDLCAYRMKSPSSQVCKHLTAQQVEPCLKCSGDDIHGKMKRCRTKQHYDYIIPCHLYLLFICMDAISETRLNYTIKMKP